MAESLTQVSRSPQGREAAAQRGEAERGVGSREGGKASEGHRESFELPRRGHSAEVIESALGIFGRRNIGVLLQLLSRDFERRARGTLQARGHTDLLPSHQVVFASLGRDGARLTALAQQARMTKQAMGQIVDDLEQLGYVERVPDPADGRAKIVRFTAAGLDFVCDAAEVLDEIWKEYAALLGTSELEQVQDALHDLLRGVRRDPSPGS